ncbi:hypothetical protein HK101_003996, partial [Irineochytrium annulatum]
TSNDLKTSTGDYYSEYMIKNPAQILPQYIVTYEFDESREKQSRERPKCDNCESEPATIYCSSDSANLCNKCDSLLHTSKLASRHIRTPIGKGTDVFGHCRHHPEKLIEFFCSQCHVPVCVFCKMVGNHANGEASRHQLVSVSEAYATVLQEAMAHDPILQSRRTEIVNQIAAVNHRAKAVEKMGSQIETQIKEMYERVLSEARGQICDKACIFLFYIPFHPANWMQKQLDILKGDELELKRQMDEIEHLEEFLKYQQQGDATQFLFSWARHQHFRSELHDFAFFRNEIDVELDLKVVGSISVLTESMAGPGGSAPLVMKKQTSQKQLQHQHSQPQIAVAHSHSHGHSHGDVTRGGGHNMAHQHHHVTPTPGLVGMGMPRKVQERRVQRRTSDFFAETLSLTPAYSWGADDAASDNHSVFNE